MPKKETFFRILIFVLPLFVVYSLFILCHPPLPALGDEGRYLNFAKNLAQGFYAPAGYIKLPSGPGYPLLLAPMVILHFPLIAFRLLNAFLLAGAVIYFFYTLRIYTGFKKSLTGAYLLGIYPLFFKSLYEILTETFAVFLLCAFLFHWCRSLKNTQKTGEGHLIAAGIFLGWLSLTKVFFGYVLMLGIPLFLLLLVLKHKRQSLRCGMIVIFAFILCLPYLNYTRHLTGKFPYWGSYGGPTLYWMSTPYDGEYGDWKGNSLWHLEQFQESLETENLVKNHKEIFDATWGMDQVEWDAYLKQKSIENIKAHPVKFLKNWICNLGRLFFNTPYSYTPQQMSTLFNIFPNMFILVLGILSLIPPWVDGGYRRVPYEIWCVLLFGLISLAGSSLVSAYERQFRILVPAFLLWIFYVYHCLIEIRFKSTENGVRE